MQTDNLIQWLSQGPFFLFAFCIGCLVSIDVFVVEFTRDYGQDKEAFLRNGWTTRMKWMSIWHALFHSGSFFLYLVVIYIFQTLAFIPIDLFDLPEGVGLGLLTIIHFIIICFIWTTYTAKVVEDHSCKDDDSKKIGRQDMKMLVDFMRVIAHRLKIGDKARGLAIAGSVAVDMLAISALLKIYLLPNGNSPAISSFSGLLLIDIFMFAVVIFFVVLFWVFTAQAIGSAIRSINLIIFLRFAEPFAVFFILAGTVRAGMQFGAENYAGEISKYGLLADLLFAMVVLLSLVIASGCSGRSLYSIYGNRSVDSLTHNPKITASELFSRVKNLIPATLGFFGMFSVIIFSLSYAYSTIPGRDTHNHLIEATGIVSSIVLLFTLLFTYSPSKRLDRLEHDGYKEDLEFKFENSDNYWYRFFGAFLGLIALNTYNLTMFGRSFEVDSIMLWSVYLVSTWLLFNLRSWRFRRAASENTLRISDANLSEFLNALGSVSGFIALVAIVIVTALKDGT